MNVNVTTINSIIGIAVQAMTAARVARDAARAANPTAPDGSLPSDGELIEKFLTDAKLLEQEATDLRAWLKTLPVLFLLVLMPSIAFAQHLNIYTLPHAVGATPITEAEFSPAAVNCNQLPPPPTASTINPTRVTWDDPAVAGRVCQWTDATGGPLLGLPIGPYEATLQFTNMVGRGPESPVAPFSRLSPPTTAPAGLKLTRPGS